MKERSHRETNFPTYINLKKMTGKRRRSLYSLDRRASNTKFRINATIKTDSIVNHCYFAIIDGSSKIPTSNATHIHTHIHTHALRLSSTAPSSAKSFSLLFRTLGQSPGKQLRVISISLRENETCTHLVDVPFNLSTC